MVLQLHTAIRRLSASPGPRNHGQSAKIGKLGKGAFDVVDSQKLIVEKGGNSQSL